MKKLLCLLLAITIPLGMILPASAAEFGGLTTLLDGPSNREYGAMWVALLVLVCISCVLMICSLVSLCLRKKRKDGFRTFVMATLYIITLLSLAVTLLCGWRYLSVQQSTPEPPTTMEPTTLHTDPPAETTIETTVDTTEVPPTEPEETSPLEAFHPHHTENTDPANWDIDWKIIVNKAVVDSYQREEPISFGEADSYTDMKGIITFRGDNYRTGATYGTSSVGQRSLSKVWSKSVGSLNDWTGCGWTGQPLVVQWDAETKAIMNLYPEKKAKEDLVEVIYATLDGYIYFLDLDDGSKTRDSVYVGMNFKGAGALDPRGYPIMYVGSGDFVGGKAPRMYIISLIDGSILYERGYNESASLRGWCAFDSSPLVDAETDTLIWPGESGLLYTIKLNTNYDQAAGTLSINPEEPVMTRYSTNRSNGGSYWLGYEDSACIVGNYLFASENGGMFFCVDLNTMELIWAQDTKDDSNASPVFEWGEDGNGYLYTAPSLHWTASGSRGSISLYKLDAQTGEIIWEVPYECGTIDGVSGGVQATPLLGKAGTELEGMIVFSVSRSPNMYDGILVALDTETGETRWELSLSSYAWSSPTGVYTTDGRAYIILADSGGNVRLIDGSSGTVLDSISLNSTLEASPVVYGNRIILGTRSGYICALDIS